MDPMDPIAQDPPRTPFEGQRAKVHAATTRAHTEDTETKEATMLFDLINPSDSVTLEAADVDIARAVCLLLGEGKYALNDENGEEVLPLFLFGGFGEWLAEHNFDLTNICDTQRPALIACLESASCCGLKDRKAIRAAVGNDPTALARYNDEKRSSLNDICGFAHKLAAHNRAKAETERTTE